MKTAPAHIVIHRQIDHVFIGAAANKRLY